MFECPHHLWLSLPLKLHSFQNKTIICRSSPPLKILGQKVWKLEKNEQLVNFECPHHLWLSLPLKLHSFQNKTIICRSSPPPKILGQKVFECPTTYDCPSPHHWSYIHFWAKPPFASPHHFPKIWDKKPKATTKVILTSHQKPTEH